MQPASPREQRAAAPSKASFPGSIPALPPPGCVFGFESIKLEDGKHICCPLALHGCCQRQLGLGMCRK